MKDDNRVWIPDEFNPSPVGVSRAQFMGEGYDWGALSFYVDRIHEMGITGKGVNVGIIDSGMFYGHPDLDDDVQAENFSSDPNIDDIAAHCTHVRGIIGMRSNGKGLIGVAPDAKLPIAKALAGKYGVGSVSDFIAALTWMVYEIKPDVLNMSLTLDRPNAVVDKILKDAETAGILCVAASGNMGANKVGYPASNKTVLAVGAIDQKDHLPNWSNRGKVLNDLDVVAPGVNVRSSWTDGDYRNSDGTSMAAPHVAALAALTIGRLKELKMKCDPPNVRLLIKSFAKDLGTPGNDLSFGSGKITGDWFGVDTVQDDVDRIIGKDNGGCLFGNFIRYFLPWT